MGGDIYRFTSDGKYEILGKKTSTGTGTWSCNTNGFIELNGVKSSLVNQFEWRIAPTEEEVKNGKKILKFGMKGDFVTVVQNKLKERGLNPGSSDGKFGKKTKKAVIDYQTQMGLESDGIVGKDTYTKLFFVAPKQEPINLSPETQEVPQQGQTQTTEPGINPVFEPQTPEIQRQSPIQPVTPVEPQQTRRMNRRQSRRQQNAHVDPKPTIKESLKQNLKTTLVEKTKEKENLIVETNIIKNRFALISEGQTFKTEESKIDLIENVFVETNYLSIQGYNSDLINEGLFSFIGSILGGGVGSTPQVVGEYIAKWLTRKLGVPQGSYIEGVIVSLVTSMNISDYDKIFTDCRFLTNKLSDALIEGYLFQMQSQKGLESGVSGFLLSAIRNSIMEYFAEDKDGLIQKLEDKIAEFLCPAISKISGKVQDKADELKDKALA
jgi:peptidoglycan hydrolase-like protein with peptidoglycan-binding domain